LRCEPGATVVLGAPFAPGAPEDSSRRSVGEGDSAGEVDVCEDGEVIIVLSWEDLKTFEQVNALIFRSIRRYAAPTHASC
jgi:hypothetical protein